MNKQAGNGWRLRRATLHDVDGLHALASKPPVYHYLFDGAAPSRAYILGRVADGIDNVENAGLGLWLLENSAWRYAGGVELKSYPFPGFVELTYLLDPSLWRQGLATRMARTVITQAFLSSRIDAVIAGADLPNTASFALMRRLGMRFHKAVRYPLGAGAEYALHRDDAASLQESELLPLD